MERDSTRRRARSFGCIITLLSTQRIRTSLMKSAQQEAAARPNPQQDHVIVLVNPRAGRRGAADRVEQLRRILTARGLHVEVHDDLAKAAALADAWREAGVLRALVAAGGDGTAAELANRTMPGVPLTILAAGSANLLARRMELPADPQRLADVVLEGRTVRLDAGRANGRLFLLMASAGFDADVVERLHAGRRGHIQGWPTYVAHMLRSIRDYTFPEIRVQSEQGEHRARWCFAFNLPCYAGNFHFAPEADGADGQLDVCLFGRGGVWAGLKFAAAVKLGVQRRLADWREFRAVRLRLESAAGAPYQLDGDPGGRLPLDLEVEPGRLHLLAPRPRSQLLTPIAT